MQDMIPPQNEAMVDTPMALPPSPFFAIGLPSRVVMMAAGVPGMFSRMALMEPP